MRLPMYITGIANHNIDLKKMDGCLFKKLGYEVARKFHGEVIGYILPKYPLNYFRLDIKIGENIMSILLHEYFPYVATASYENELQIHYFDSEYVIHELRPYYTVLEMAFLNEAFKPNFHDLSETELKNEKYWRPNTNGEVIFNCWD
ncbi:hypothetical protein [Sporosarcina sp. P17b]|uniref:hypothetical protein n=1 Tax=Sporosarcina sp. P17b TaxID=2048260 RepID=UPI000C16B6C5|nr:hypothetical protein [Sporosarcina sp. P17b]PIC73120.1 hypothetical protein CSV76_11150 [Sporosarcina sp. P17b]